MALSVPSRYAVLKIEDDDFKPATSKPAKQKDKKKDGAKVEAKKSATKPQPTNKKPNPTKPTTASAQPAAKKDKKKKKESAEQWEQWKQKDNEMVDGTYAEDLQTAILQSKLDYEKNKDVYKLQKKQTEQEKKPNGPQKKKKNKVMTLSQFNNLVSSSEDTARKGDESDTSHKSGDNNFFEKIKSDTKAEINKEATVAKNKAAKNDRKSFNNDTITISQLQDKLDAMKLENSKLKSNLENAKKEILNVKTRNKSLCEILASGEMKDKAEVLMELEKLYRIRDELTDEVKTVNAALEQERSKVRALTEELQTYNHNHNYNHNNKNKEKPKTSHQQNRKKE